MRTTTKHALALTTALTMSLALGACGSGDEGEDGGNESDSSSAEIRVWLNGADTPQDARDYLKKTFEDENPGATLTIEEQQWEGLVERLTTALSSESETPDVVEVGNTQAATFTTAGAFTDITDQLEDLGGDDLLPGFVEAGTADGVTYAVPYYAGSKYVFYRKDLFKKSGLEVPTTTDEFVDAAIQLKKDNPKPANFSGFWLPGQDWRNGVTFVWNDGGDLAVEDGDAWAGALSTPESQEGLATVQALFEQASGAAKDGNETDPQVPFCNNEMAMMSAPGWMGGVLADETAGCPDIMDKVGVFALPGNDGNPAPVLLGGSNIAVAAKSPDQDLAKKAVAIMLSDDYQKILAANGLTPAAAGWASVEGARILEDFFVGIANGGDIAELAAEADKAMEEQLN